MANGLKPLQRDLSIWDCRGKCRRDPAAEIRRTKESPPESTWLRFLRRNLAPSLRTPMMERTDQTRLALHPHHHGADAKAACGSVSLDGGTSRRLIPNSEDEARASVPLPHQAVTIVNRLREKSPDTNIISR